MEVSVTSPLPLSVFALVFFGLEEGFCFDRTFYANGSSIRRVVPWLLDFVTDMSPL